MPSHDDDANELLLVSFQPLMRLDKDAGQLYKVTMQLDKDAWKLDKDVWALDKDAFLTTRVCVMHLKQKIDKTSREFDR